MAAKKTTNKASKGAAKKQEPERLVPSTFSILDTPDDFSLSVKQSLTTALTKKKGRIVDFTTQEDLRIEMLPIRQLYLQWCINNWGIPMGMSEIFGKDGTGKSSLLYHMIGGFMMGGSPCCVMPGENKPVDRSWALRCFSTDSAMSHKIANKLHVLKASRLDDMADRLEAWVLSLRDPGATCFIPPYVPIVVAVDPLGKLATRAQSAGEVIYEDIAKASKKKAFGKKSKADTPTEIGAKGNSWDRAKWLHDWMPRLALLQSNHNVHAFFVSHQNDKDPAGAAGFGAAPPSFIPQWSQDLTHRTKTGGNGLNQNVALQLALSSVGFYYSDGKAVARKIAIRPYKNSYGPESRTAFFALKQTDYEDREGFIDAGVRFDYPMVEWCAENNFLGIRKLSSPSVKDPRFSSTELGFTQASLTEAARILSRQSKETFDTLGRHLGIPGYVDVYERLVRAIDSVPDAPVEEEVEA